MEENLGHMKMDFTMEPIRNGAPKRKYSIEVEIDNLVPFQNHPFQLYEGQRFTDMVESIRANGVIVPITARPHAEDEGKFEILSGHNRVQAAKKAGFESVPAVIREGLSDEEALLIVTETNLIQRSFADLKHSERAVAIATHYEAMKNKSGYRSDLLDEIEELTCSPLANRLRTINKIGGQYGLSKDTVARYLRVNKLIQALKVRLDNDEIAMRTAVSLSYLRSNEQAIVEDLIAQGKKISMKQADILKAESAKSEMDKAVIEQIFEPESLPSKIKPFKLNSQFLSKYFNDTQSTEEIESAITEALEQYFSNRSS